MKTTIIILMLTGLIFGCNTIKTTDIQPTIFLNQSGFNKEWSKRFTTSKVKNNTKFRLVEVENGKKLYAGKINNNIGDFSNFRPSKRGLGYAIEVGKTRSDTFNIAPFLMFYTSFKPALQFMIDARSVVGTHNSAYGGCPWRDGTYYSFEMPSLVLLYLSNPDFFGNIPPEINYELDKKRVLNQNFTIVKSANDSDALSTTRRYYTELDAPVGKNIPDIIQLIHWGAGWYLIEPESKDPSGGTKGDIIHDQTIEQFSFFLYGYPFFKQYFTERFYKQVLELTLKQWVETKLFDVKRIIGTFKGRETPGHSILPNLLMSEVAKREGLDEKPYLKAAINQTKWIIDSLDLSDPITTKGQRMSEYKLYTSLTTFYNKFPKIAPKGLKNYLERYADIVIKRSENKWDFRKYNDSLWSIPRHGAGLPKTHPGWNEPGNLASFPALAFELSEITDNPKKKERLEILAVANFDNLFGRNPVGAHSANRGVKDYAGVERGWPIHYGDDVCARMELIRGALSSSASSEHYIDGVHDDFRWPEGWVNFNAAFNVGLAYASLHAMEFSFKNNLGKKNAKIQFEKEFILSFRAPVSMTNQLKNSVNVNIYDGEQLIGTIKLKETKIGSSIYESPLTISLKTSKLPNTIQVSESSKLNIKYGYGVFGKKIDIKVVK